MAYVDGFVIPVPLANRAAYEDLARRVAPVFKRHGALKVVECWGDDVPDGVVTSFPMAVKTEPGETVVFSWIWWADKAARDAGNAAFMEDPAIKDFDHASNPFDGKRMIYGGFEVMLDE
jgi:uncharacterized protein YbaA (DUF1428 family)